MTRVSHRPLLFLAASLSALILWSVWKPTDMLTWWMEAAPILIAMPILFATGRRFPLSTLLYAVIAVHGTILLIGAHYTYAEVPLFNWLRDTLDLSRNHFDRVGHFFQGFTPALLGRELLIRTSPLKRGGWLFFFCVCMALAVSSVYELIEWAAAVALGSGADAFLATQGDVWDTQKDMAMAGLGALTALLFFARLHDRSMSQILVFSRLTESAMAALGVKK